MQTASPSRSTSSLPLSHQALVFWRACRGLKAPELHDSAEELLVRVALAPTTHPKIVLRALDAVARA
jgi:hypothetical protein